MPETWNGCSLSPSSGKTSQQQLFGFQADWICLGSNFNVYSIFSHIFVATHLQISLFKAFSNFLFSIIPSPGHPALQSLLFSARSEVRVHRDHTSSVGIPACINSSGLCLESVAGCRKHTSYVHVYLEKYITFRIHIHHVIYCNCFSQFYYLMPPWCGLCDPT